MPIFLFTPVSFMTPFFKGDPRNIIFVFISLDLSKVIFYFCPCYITIKPKKNTYPKIGGILTYISCMDTAYGRENLAAKYPYKVQDSSILGTNKNAWWFGDRSQTELAPEGTSLKGNRVVSLVSGKIYCKNLVFVGGCGCWLLVVVVVVVAVGCCGCGCGCRLLW